MDRFDDDALFAELRELRPEPRPEFTAELDQRAAAGFPRRIRPSTTSLPFALLGDRWREASTRRRLMPVLAVALAALVVATAVIAISGSGGKSRSIADSLSGAVAPSGESGVYAEEGAEAGEEVSSGTAAAPAHQSGTQHSGGGANHLPGKAAGGGGESAESIYQPETPSIEAGGQKSSNLGLAGGTSAGTKLAEKAGAEYEAPLETETESAEESSGGDAEQAESTEHAGEIAGAERGRDIERSSYVVLGTKPDEVAGAASKVYAAVHAADGIVLHSSVNSGKTAGTGATFALLIPTAKVDDALAAISQIAEVRERHDATKDITAPTVSANEELRDSNATIEGLLKELGDVETEAERESVEARLREERRRHASIRASLDNLHERASMSEVSVRIVTSRGANASPGVGDALHDAGHILTIAAGVLLIALAFLAPIALIALLIWLINRFRVRRLRERALG